MGTNKNLFIILGVAVVALIATVMSGTFNTPETVDPAQEFMKSQGITAAPAPTAEVEPEAKPPATPVDQEATPVGAVPGVIADAADGEASGDVAAVEGAEGSVEAVEVATEEGLDGETEVATEPGTEDVGEAGLLDDGLTEPVTSDDDLFIEDEESLDPIERFKEMDPREIIDLKYDDLEGRLTTPWDEEDPDNWIPWTGRPDPLTRVHDAIPEELMPARAGETDNSAIQTYAASAVASLIVDQFSFLLRCHNVLQVGLEKRASFTLPGQRFQLREGDAFPVPFSVEGVNGNVIISVTSISTDEVIVAFTANADAVTLGISKTQHYIPRKGF